MSSSVATAGVTSGVAARAAAIAAAPVPQAPSIAAEAGGRVLGYDVVRAFAALAVIWDHAGRSPAWNEYNLAASGGWGTAFLNSLAGFFVVFSLRKHWADGAARFAVHRAVRLYAPFVVWSLLYVAARGLNYLLFGKVTTLQWNWGVLLIGTTYHLWFLPYLLIITFLTLPLVAFAIRDRSRMAAMAVVFVVCAAALLLAPEPAWTWSAGVPGLMARHVLARAPGFLLGLGFGLWMLAGFRPRVSVQNAWACAGIVCVMVYLALTTELPRNLINRIGATAAFIITLAPWRGPAAEIVGRVGRLGFGVYLCHVLFVEFFIALGRGMGVEPALWWDVCVFAASAAGSFAFSYAIRRFRLLAWLIP